MAKRQDPQVVEATTVTGGTSAHVVTLNDNEYVFDNQTLLAFYKQIGAAVMGANV